MTTAQLKNKLTKMNIQFTEVDYNGYNKDICFCINNMNFAAGFNAKSEIIEDFSQTLTNLLNTQIYNYRHGAQHPTNCNFQNLKTLLLCLHSQNSQTLNKRLTRPF